MALSTVSGILTRLASVSSVGADSPNPCATSAHDQASSYTSTSRSSAASSAAPAPRTRRAKRYKPSPYPPQRARRVGVRLGVRPHRDRRLQPTRLRRGARRRESHNRLGFLRRAIAFYARHGIHVEQLMTDNGAAYRATLARHRLPRLGIHHCAPGPTDHKQTAKQNASSAPCSPAGPTARSTAPATNGPAHLTAGSGHTTIAQTLSPRPPTTHHQNQPARALHLGARL